MSVSFNKTSKSASLQTPIERETTSLHRPLFVKQLSPRDYPRIARIAREWNEIAVSQALKCEPGEKNAKDQFNASFLVASEIEALCLLKFRTQRGVNDRYPNKLLFACEDEAGKIHGIAIISMADFTLRGHSLMTHPRNIRCKANQLDPERVEGVGRTFAIFFQKIAQLKGLDAIELQPYASAIPFYEKFGFEHTGLEMVKRFPHEQHVTSKL